MAVATPPTARLNYYLLNLGWSLLGKGIGKDSSHGRPHLSSLRRLLPTTLLSSSITVVTSSASASNSPPPCPENSKQRQEHE